MSGCSPMLGFFSSILNAVIGLHVLTGRPSGVSPESWCRRPRSYVERPDMSFDDQARSRGASSSIVGDGSRRPRQQDTDPTSNIAVEGDRIPIRRLGGRRARSVRDTCEATPAPGRCLRPSVRQPISPRTWRRYNRTAVPFASYR
jgi:hypothetical protein